MFIQVSPFFVLMMLVDSIIGVIVALAIWPRRTSASSNA